MTSMTGPGRVVIGGVDTHRDTHHSAARDEMGRELGDRAFPANQDQAGTDRQLPSHPVASRTDGHSRRRQHVGTEHRCPGRAVGQG
jgi:hypothetical protein